MQLPFDFALTQDQEQHATELHAGAVIIDGLGGSMIRRPSPEEYGLDRIDQYRTNGVTVTNETIASGRVAARQAMSTLFDYWCLGEVSGGRTMEMLVTDDINRCKQQGKLGFLYGFQSATPFEDDLSLVPIFHRLGVRIVNLAYNERNLVGDGCYEQENRGLTAFGKSVVLEMNRVGITVDLSHTGERTALDASRVSRFPVVYSHSCVKAIREHPRNLTDEQIRLAASTGGLVGICPHSIFLERQTGVRPTLHDFIDHIQYVTHLVGADHVAIGTDLFGGQTLGESVFRFKFGRISPNFWGGYSIATKYCEGFDNVFGWINVTRGLISRGFSDDQILKILGGNWIRVFRDTWKDSLR